MFTTVAFFGVAFLAWLVMRSQNKENAGPERQDLKLIAYLLAGVIVMLGVIADQMAR